ncbi:follistatin-related protein 3-like [Crassostrea virginica]|uniref:Follistatin-related protein 3-like n=1 Tax=Crassostrea virginica TaxID=6565 RepID=A0A8B8EU79_CRAVI|nr:follistatin-related protein 3-like [Crassostrea virginica]
MALLKFLAPILLISVVRAQFFNFNTCASILKEDCFQYGSSAQCGSNGVTYRNRCDFSKAHCEDTSLHIASHSACPMTTTPPPTTAPPGVVVTSRPIPSTLAPILHGSEAVLDFFCLNLAFKPCDGGSNPVCGNDTITYQNPCEFEKSRCTHRSIHIVHYGNCSGDPYNP